MRKCLSVGGQALIEGIMMKSPLKTVIAVRNKQKEIEVIDFNEGSVKDKCKLLNLPIIRGAVTFVESLIQGYKALMISADKSGMTELEEAETEQKKLKTSKGTKETADSKNTDSDFLKKEKAEENIKKAELGKEQEQENKDLNKNGDEKETQKEKSEPKKLSGAVMGATMVIASVLGVLLAIALFMYVPAKLFNLLNGLLNNNISFLRALFEGVLKIIIFILYIVLVSKTKDIKRVFMYHGAEHKTIFCYENGLMLTKENVKKQSRFHPRCGTSFMFLMLFVGILLSFILQTVFPAITKITWLWVLIKILILPLICGIGYELIRYCGKHQNVLVKIISAPGLWMQRITTKEPDLSMCEVGIASLLAVLPKEEAESLTLKEKPQEDTPED